MTTFNPDSLALEAELITIDFQNMLTKWGSHQPPRGGLHASSLLVNEQEWCVRRHVLAEMFPNDAQPPETQNWEWRTQAIFENGWHIHMRWQNVFERFGKVVVTTTEYGPADIRHEPELDLTHYDPDRNLYFSPDAILDFGPNRYVVEIKGIKQESFVELTDSLTVAMRVCETVRKAVHQANLYMHLLELQKAIILIENKNTQDFRVWVIEYDKNMAKEPIDRAYQVKGKITLAKYWKGYPARVCQSRGDALARKCPMRDKCFSKEYEEKRYE